VSEVKIRVAENDMRRFIVKAAELDDSNNDKERTLDNSPSQHDYQDTYTPIPTATHPQSWD
jgi:hypothetical protein